MIIGRSGSSLRTKKLPSGPSKAQDVPFAQGVEGIAGEITTVDVADMQFDFIFLGEGQLAMENARLRLT
jgi:hypothetical protein